MTKAAAFSTLFFTAFSTTYAQETITPERIAAADLKKGERLFLRCRSCHTLAEGEPNRLGPNLWGVFGREIGAVEGFRYSKAVQEADFIWTVDLLNEWLTKPRDFLPGNRMAFAGLPKEEDRTALLAYLLEATGGAESSESQNPEDGSSVETDTDPEGSTGAASGGAADPEDSPESQSR